jgi:hypothetical protein
LLNLRHPLIAPLIGFDFPVESGGRWELKIARLHAFGGSLADVLANRPAWWTPTAKAKAVVGIALALRFAHGLGLLHGAVKAANVFSMWIGEFKSRTLARSALKAVRFGRFRAKCGPRRRTAAPLRALFLRLPSVHQDGRSSASRRPLSFVDLLDRLKQNDFEIVARVESAQESGNWVF